MSDDIWSANGVSAVQHTEQKDESVARVPCRIGPLSPHKGVGSVHRRHGCADNDGNQNAGNDKESPSLLQHREDPIGKKHAETSQPIDNDISNKDVPSLRHEFRVESRVHGHRLCPNDFGRGGDSEDPSEEIPPSRKPATNAPILPRRDGRPVVHSTGRRHRGSELRDGSGDEPVKEGYRDEFIKYARRSAIVDCDSHASSEGHPDVAACDGQSADGEEAEVAVEFLLVAGCVDGDVNNDAGDGFGVFPFTGRLVI